jgi:ATP-dependent helicase HrpA
VFGECFFADSQPPRTKEQFASRLEAGRARLTEIAERLAKVLQETLQALRAVRHSLDALKAPTYRDAVADMREQLAQLTPDGFIASTPNPWFECLPRYLRSMVRRLERLPANVKRDGELQRLLAPFVALCGELRGKSTHRIELDKLRWMIEEYRVSLFAQDLKTSVPVSEKRLQDQANKARDESKK